MKIPSEIKIAGHKFKIYRTDLEQSTSTGHANMVSQSITIRDGNCPEDKYAEALLHEVIEVIIAYFDIELSHPGLTTISEILFQTIRDNKLDFLKK